MAKSKIEWTKATWNPVTGCSKTSAGCKHCYAEVMARRLKAMGQPNYQNGFEVSLHEHMLGRPLEWKTPQTVFVNSMSDLFHENVPLDFIKRAFNVMLEARWHRFQILTKRAERLAQIAGEFSWPKNVWMGVTVESAEFFDRIDQLRRTGAAIKFLSLEPLLGPVPNLDLRGIDWVIAGGESGPGARPMKIEWVRELRDACLNAGVPFFFKQWGGVNKKRAGRVLDGQIWSQMPRPLEHDDPTDDGFSNENQQLLMED
jgi:protein gp37